LYQNARQLATLVVGGVRQKKEKLMKLFRNAILIIILSFSFSLQAQECSSKLVDWSDYNRTLGLLKSAYRSGDFQSVESALSCLMADKNTFTSGKSGAVAVYWFFRKEMHAPGANEEDKSRIDNWKKAVLGSPFAEFAELRFSYSQAWNARGAEFANETREDQFKRFKKKLLETEKLILSKENKFKETPISYNLLMAVALDTNGTQTTAMDAFNYGVTNWPSYYDFYEVLLTRLVPKWGGSWEEVDGFINYWATNLQPTEANSIYARFYYNVHTHNRIDPRSTLVDWQKLKDSLISLYSKYPTQEHFEIAASYGCIYGDKDFYTNVVTKNNVISSAFWISGSSKESCDNYINSIPNKKHQRTP